MGPPMDLRKHFRELHTKPFVIPNPWDVGSARILASLGFQALATSSAGFANALGRLDGGVTREEALEHARQISAATSLAVSADFENGFGDAPEYVAETVALASQTGLAGCSIEDYGPEQGLYPKELAAARVRAAVEASRKDSSSLVITARCENFFRGNPDLADAIARLQAYQEAGADVLYAPAIVSLDDVRSVVAEVDRPLNVIIMPGVRSRSAGSAGPAASIPSAPTAWPTCWRRSPMAAVSPLVAWPAAAISRVAFFRLFCAA